MPRKRVSRKDDEFLKGDPKARAFIATFFSIIGFIIAFLSWKKDQYVMFYARQSLVLFIVMIVAGIINAILALIPIVGWIVMTCLNIFVFILWLFSWIYALSGEKKDVIFIGEYAKKINL